MRRAQAAGSVLGMNDESNAAKRPQRGEKADKGENADKTGAEKAAKAAATPRKRESVVDDPIQRAIGDKLRAVFDEVVQQPVPERFAELLRKLAEQEQQKK